MKDDHIITGICTLIKKAETELPKDVLTALQQAYSVETGIAKLQLETILKNVELAKKTGCPMCQDTGIQTFFIRVGVHSPYIHTIKELISKAVKKATVEIPLRPNTVDPFTGKNHGDNTGENVPLVTWDICNGSDLSITALPKGGGSENMSALGMLKPGVGIRGVQEFVVKTVVKAGGSPCPPTVLGIGIGGGADDALKLARRALLRPLGVPHHQPRVARIEKELLTRINKTGIGPMGLGGKTTVLDVHIETAHRHPASLPIGIVFQCWAYRKARMVIHANGSWKVD